MVSFLAGMQVHHLVIPNIYIFFTLIFSLQENGIRKLHTVGPQMPTLPVTSGDLLYKLN